MRQGQAEDPEALPLQRLGLEGAGLAARKASVGLHPSDEALLEELGRHLVSRYPEFSDAFYERLMEDADARRHLADPAVVRRLRASQQRYMEELLGGRYDHAYARSRVRLGLRHRELGLEPRLYIGAYAQHLTWLAERIREVFGARPGLGERALAAVARITLFDLGLALEAQRAADEDDARARQAREAEGAANRVFKALFEHAPDAVLVVDEQRRYSAANAAACRLFGLAREELIGRSSGELYHPEDRAQFPRLWERFLAEGHWTHRARIVRPDGSVRTVEFHARANFLPGRHLSILRDVTEAVDDERILREIAGELSLLSGPHFFRRLVELLARECGADLAVVGELDGDTHVRTLAAWADGREQPEFRYALAGTPCAEVVTRRSACRWDVGVVGRFPEDAILAELGAEAYCGVPLIGDGRVQGLLSAIWRRPPPDLAGVEGRMSLLAARAMAELERQRSHAALLKAHEERRQVEKVEAVSRLAAGIAHDFNNALAVVLGYTDLLLADGALPGQVRGPLQAIQQAGLHATALTRQLLGLARPRRSGAPAAELNRVLRDALPLLRSLLGEDCRLEVVLSEAPAPVAVDPVALEQVLLNLASNARDAMPQGGCFTLRTCAPGDDCPECRAGPGTAPGAWVRLVARDTGCGMPPEVAARAFDPFFTTKPVGKGTGLGLSSARQTVAEAGGEIRIESTPGEGTTVRLILPVAEEAPDAEAVPSPHAGATSLIGIRLLLVEDEPALMHLVRGALTDAGAMVHTARSAEEALRAALPGADAPDLVITDVVLPGLAGPEFARILQGRHPELPVLFLSGYPDEALRQRGLDPLRQTLLRKPFTASALLGAVRGLLGPGRKGRAKDAAPARDPPSGPTAAPRAADPPGAPEA